MHANSVNDKYRLSDNDKKVNNYELGPKDIRLGSFDYHIAGSPIQVKIMTFKQDSLEL